MTKYCKCWNENEANGQICERCDGRRPTAEELQFQKDNVWRLNQLEYDRDTELFNRIMSYCTEFENKYC
jgi:hypothetical protein